MAKPSSPQGSSHPSLPPQGPRTVAASEFPPHWLVQTVAPGSPKETETGVHFSRSPCLSPGRIWAAAPEGVEPLAAVHLCAVCCWHSVYLRQKPPRNAPVVRSLDLAFLLWAGS